MQIGCRGSVRTGASAVVHEERSGMPGSWRNLWSDGFDLAPHANSIIGNQLKSVTSIGLR
jgi:hypothetical protein